MNETLPSESELDKSPVSKALRILTHLAGSNEPVPLAELSRALNLPKPTSYRLARALESAGFIHRDPLTRRYLIGTAFEDLAWSALRHGVGQAPRRLLMNALAERVAARVNLVTLKAGNLSLVEWVESTAPLRVDVGSEPPIPVHCTASGKLLLAFGSPDLQEHVLASAPFAAYTKKTITSARALALEIAEIRRRGYAEDDQELWPGVNCLAVPVHNRIGAVVAGLAVMAPVASLPLQKLRKYLPDIRDCAARISAELGWPSNESPVNRASASRDGRKSRSRSPVRVQRVST